MMDWKALCSGLLLAMLAACTVGSHRPAPSVMVIPPPPDLPASAPVVADVVTAEPAPSRPAPEPPKPPTPAEMRAEPGPPAPDNPAQPAAPAVTPAATPAATPLVTPVITPAAAPPPAAEPPAPPRQVLYFKPDAYKLDAADMPRLEAHARRLKASPALHLVIQAYADWRGDKDYNLALSKKRAQTVARQLVAMGAPPGQIEIGYHGERSQHEGRSERAVAADRRVELSYR